ncbi:MAG: hypothetical protein JEY97_08645 [Bacteroidales bacterium]|nr:hypothetical protein [Bacteroidales bacterium]
MKKIILLIIVLMSFTSIKAQRIVEKTIKIEKDQDVELDFQFADDIIIKTWEKNEIFVKVSVNINDNIDNDDFTINIFNKKSEIEIKSEIKNLGNKDENTITLRKDKETGEYHYKGNCTQMDLYFEVYLPQGKNLEVKTISGNIEVTDLESEMNLETISGDVDLTLNPNIQADIEMSTISGEIYSNMDLDFGNQESLRRIGGIEISSQLNGGGIYIDLETISGDILLRKK